MDVARLISEILRDEDRRTISKELTEKILKGIESISHDEIKKIVLDNLDNYWMELDDGINEVVNQKTRKILKTHL